MTISLKHAFECDIPDGSDDTIVRPSNWNAEHVITMATDRMLGRITAEEGSVEELTASQIKVFLDLEIGTDVQAYDADTAKLDVAQTWTAAQTFSNTGLHILDTGGDHDYIIVPGEDATADRTLTLDLNDADRTLSLPSPTFTNLTQTGYHDLTEIAEPASPAANVARVRVIDDGAGVTTVGHKDSSGNIVPWSHFNQSGTGNVTRTQQAKLQETVTPEDFGVAGDGATDDASDFQNALDALETAGGGLLRCSAKTYRIDSQLDWPSNVSLDLGGGTLDFGAATGSQFILAEGSAATPIALTANATLGDRTITVGDTSSISAGDLLRIWSEDEFDPDRTSSWRGELIYVEEVVDSNDLTTRTDLQDNYATADSASIEVITPVENIVLSGPGKIIGNATQESTQNGVVFNRARKCRVKGIEFQEIDLAHLIFRDCEDCHADGHNHFGLTRPSTQGYGVSFKDATQDCSATHNYFDQCRHSLSTNNTGTYGGVPRRILFESNVIRHSVYALGGSMTGGDAIDTHAAADFVTIRNNTLLGSAGQGINVECPNVVIEGNHIEDCLSSGIACHNETPQAGSARIVNNTVRNMKGTSSRCIRVALGSATDSAGYESVQVTGNIVDGSDGTLGFGIEVLGTSGVIFTDAVVTGNIVKNVSASSAAVSMEYVDGFTWGGNIITTSLVGQAGMRADDCNYGAISGNVIKLISASTAGGFHFAGTSTNLGTITGNTVNSPSASNSKGVTFGSSISGVGIGANEFSECTTPVNGTGASTITIASGAITLTVNQSPQRLSVDTEASAATDDLDTITGGFTGQVLILNSVANARDPTVKNGTGNIRLSGSDMVLDNGRDTITLVKHTSGDWHEVSRSDNGA